MRFPGFKRPLQELNSTSFHSTAKIRRAISGSKPSSQVAIQDVSDTLKSSKSCDSLDSRVSIDSTNIPSPKAYSHSNLKKHVEETVSTSKKFAEALGKNTTADKSQVNKIINKALEQLDSVEEATVKRLPTDSDMKDKKTIKGSVKTLKNILKKEKTSIVFSFKNDGFTKFKISISKEKGGFKDNCLTILHTAQQEIAALETEATTSTPVNKTSIDERKLSKAEKSRLNQLDKTGVAVLGEGGEDSIVQVKKQTKKKLEKQLKNWSSQMRSHQKRETIASTVIVENKEYSSKAIPMNSEFDKRYQKSETETVGEFTKQQGSSVVSSQETKNDQLANGTLRETTSPDGKHNLRIFRHAILGRNSPNQKAEQLGKAALLESIKASGLTLDQIGNDDVIPLTIASVSLVSPGNFEHKKSDDKNEKLLFEQQHEALKLLEGQEFLEIDGKIIKVKITTTPFNFGVNQGAAGIRNPLTGKTLSVAGKTIHEGHNNQFQTNEKAIKALKGSISTYKKGMYTLTENKNLARLLEDAILGEFDSEKFKGGYASLLDEINTLEREIDGFLKNEDEYLKTGHIYEVQAKIVILSNQLENQKEKLFEAIESNKDLSSDQKNTHKKTILTTLPSFQSAINCMSGKDRTGILDATIHAMNSFYDTQGKLPTREELRTDSKIQEQYTRAFVTFALEGGGLDITKLNTGLKGYKVTDEAIPFSENKDLWNKLKKPPEEGGFGPDVIEMIKGASAATGA